MNKYLTILVFFLILSFSVCEDCEESCGTFDETQGIKDNVDCVKLDGAEVCQWVSKCEQALKPEDQSTTIDCSEYLVSNPNKYSCVAVDPNDEGKYACKEEEKTQCLSVQPSASQTEINCLEYPTSSSDKKCIMNEGSDKETKPCTEQFFCNKMNGATISTDEDCYKYPAEVTSNGCVKKDDSSCIEKTLCNEVTTIEEGSDCDKYPVTYTNADTHFCFRNTDAGSSKCIEKIHCEGVKNLETGKTCADYPVKKENYHCVAGDIDPCREEKLCSGYTDDKTDEACKLHPVSEIGKVCIGSADGCVEKYSCNSVPIMVGVDCSQYPVTNKETHTCEALAEPKTNSCYEKEKEDESESQCKKATEGETDAQCLSYKVSTKKESTHKCIKNTDQTTGATPCTEQLLNCDEKKSDASDEICGQLQVNDESKEKCIKNGVKCEIINYCNFASGADDEACKVFPLQGKDKECKHKEGGNTCEEVSKSGGSSGTGEGSGEQDKPNSSSSKQEDNPSSSSSKSSNLAGGSSSKGNNNENNGNFLKMTFALLLIINLV